MYTNFTYTAPKNGIIYVNVVQTSRQKIGASINGVFVGQISLTGMTSGNPAIAPFTYFLSKGDIINVNCNSESYIMASGTKFIPFVEV